MAAGTWTFTDATRTSILNGTFDFDTDTFRLRSSTRRYRRGQHHPGVTNEVAGAFGYTTGGISLNALELSGTTSVRGDRTATSIVWTASGGSITAKYAVIYENAATSSVIAPSIQC
jgi:hypothetical protein